MALINYEIPESPAELIRDRLGAILFDELENQELRYSGLDVQGVWIERVQAFDKTELTAINISWATGQFSNKNQGSQDGSLTYFIDCYCNAKSTQEEGADVKANKNVQRLLSICRYILEDPQYKTLGFAPGFIMSSLCTDIHIKQRNDKEEDALNTSMGRLVFTIRANNSNTLKTPQLLNQHITGVRLYLTEMGYKYIYE